ncbi:class I SAM-dependent methyltransferase [Peredibacter sp. HCB2-198]|uniref:class I SAM-dependent methyltransferase n=1 Tax=Peredibacter sp. HCB2-198 TaxID=3383025 RepID=UPI0038B63C7C
MKQITIPDHTAVRVALWRAMHAQVDASPIFEDEIGLKLVAPDESWKQRGDMHPQGTRGYRASIVGRARFIEDLLLEKINQGVSQYVILGAGLDTFTQRRPDIASKIKIFEIDEPQTQAWKKQRLIDLGYGVPGYLKLVSVDFESGESWLEKLKESGFQTDKPAYVVSTGVSMYLTREANMDTLRKIGTLAPGSTFAMTFMLPPDLVEPEDRGPYEMVIERTAAAGTPFLSLFSPSKALELAKEAGLQNVEHVSRTDIIKKYFAGRPDGLQPSSGEEFLVVMT